MGNGHMGTTPLPASIGKESKLTGVILFTGGLFVAGGVYMAGVYVGGVCAWQGGGHVWHEGVCGGGSVW